MQKSNDAMYAVFCGQINEQSTQNLIRHLASATQKVKHVHLFFQSNGGISTCAIGLYEFLKTYPILISIYNMSSLQSAAVTVYLGAKRRIVGSHANFMIHGVYIQGSVVLQQTEEALRKNTEDVRHQNKMLKSFLKSHTRIPKNDLSKISNEEFLYTAKEAVKFGIATAIGDFSPPKGTKIETFS